MWESTLQIKHERANLKRDDCLFLCASPESINFRHAALAQGDSRSLRNQDFSGPLGDVYHDPPLVGPGTFTPSMISTPHLPNFRGGAWTARLRCWLRLLSDGEVGGRRNLFCCFSPRRQVLVIRHDMAECAGGLCGVRLKRKDAARSCTHAKAVGNYAMFEDLLQPTTLQDSRLVSGLLPAPQGEPDRFRTCMTSTSCETRRALVSCGPDMFFRLVLTP